LKGLVYKREKKTFNKMNYFDPLNNGNKRFKVHDERFKKRVDQLYC
jgi:hypothetical protein